MTVNWSVIWSVLRTLLVAGGPVATLLIALGFPPVQVSEWLGIGLAVIGVASVAVPGLIGALKQTDTGKITGIATMPAEAANAAVAQLPTEAKIGIKLATIPDVTLIKTVGAMPDVTQITVKDASTDGVAVAAADPAQPKVMTETQAKGTMP